MPENHDTIHEPKRLRFWHVLLGLFILLLLTWVVYYMQARAQFDAAMEKVRASGYPITLQELNDSYSIPQGEQNAADTILEALEYFYEWNTERRKLLPVVGDKDFDIAEPLDEETLQIACEYLADNKDARKLLHNAAKLKHCRYPVDFEMGLAAIAEHPGPLKKAVQMLSIEARVYAEKNQPDKAIDTIETMSALSHSLSNEPMLISQLVFIACDALTITTSERIISRSDLSCTQLNRLTDLFCGF